MAFRYAGTAWDGQKWVAAPAIITLGKQVEVIRPGTFAADGTVASQGHDANNPDSDHTVWPKSGTGIVYAIDITETPNFSIDTNFEAIRLARHPALKYAIHDRRMFSSYPTSQFVAWTWRPYSGASPHAGHGHISVHHDSRGNLTTPWPLVGQTQPPPQGDDMSFAKGLTEAQWRILYQEGIANAASEQALIDHWVTNAASRTDADYDKASASMFTELVRERDRAGSGGAHNHDGVYVKDVTVTK